jgi:branched-chain amino acid transport system ATP-binding protein
MSLVVSGLETGYGRNLVLHGVSLRVQPATIVSLLGGNAAGKSTILKSIIGLVQPHAGTIEMEDLNLTALPTDRIIAAGIAIVPENRRLFPRLTVRQNLVLGAPWASNRHEATQRLARIFDRFPFVSSVRERVAGSLSGGEQQQVAVARALMSDPRYLLLDEPSMGLAPALVERSFALLQELRAAGLGILLVEQNTEESLQASDYAYVLRDGRVTLEGIAHNLREDPRIHAAFLGIDRETEGREIDNG